MTSTKRIWLQGLVASAALAVVGIAYNGMPTLNKINTVAYSMEEGVPAPPKDVHIVPRERAMEEHGEAEEGQTLGGDGIPAEEVAPTEESVTVAMDKSFFAGINAMYFLDKLFNIGWGCGQLIIGAWVTWKFKTKRDERKLTDSLIDRRVDARLAEKYAEKYPERRKNT